MSVYSSDTPHSNPIARNFLNGIRSVEAALNELPRLDAHTPSYSQKFVSTETPSQSMDTESAEPPRSLAEERMLAEAELMTPEEMVPESMQPAGVPMGVSVEGSVMRNLPIPSATEMAPAHYLIHLCQCGLPGAILSSEILGSPMSRRRRRGR